MPWEVSEAALERRPQLLRGLAALRRRVHRRVAPLSLFVATSDEPVPFAERGRLRPRAAGPGSLWGTAFTCAWFHVAGTIPRELARQRVAALLDVDGEALVLDGAGHVVAALSSRRSPVEHRGSYRAKTRLELTEGLAPGGIVDLWLDASYNGGRLPPFGLAAVKRAELVVVDTEAEATYLDALAVAFGALDESERGARYAAAFAEAVRAGRAGRDAEARAVLAPLLGGEAETAVTFSAIGHGHLDLAWLWPIRETRRKARRTLTHQLGLAERYPEHVFGLSQPQQLAWLEADDPALFARVRDAVAEGRIEPQGGMWVEADANLPSGESLVRQSLYGQRYWAEKFGRTLDVCWLPDVFGYNANLPQLLAKAGMTRFATIKLSWNERNDFPHRSFVWRGIDGSEVLVHMPPEGTYTSSGTAVALAAALAKYPERELAPEALLVYGDGDGGGGPGPTHLEMLRRSASMDGYPAVARIEPAASFFDRLEAYREVLPRHTGELYLEKHQGTYTTQGRTKRANRLIEHRLHDLEYLAALGWLQGREYPHALLDEAWRDALLFQFHDIIPGSSIKRVYDESSARYAELDAALVAETDARLPVGPAPRTFVNTTTVPRRGHVQTAAGWTSYDAAPFATVTLRPWSGQAPSATESTLVNEHLCAVFDASGALTSLTELATGCEALAGASNRLVVFRDPWSYFDAWDIAENYRELPSRTLVASEIETFVDGPRAVRRATYRHGRSTIVQDAVLEAGVPYLLFETRVSWHERWRMLRAEFAPAPWSDEVTCDIQYGHCVRSTRNETSAERAQFEICAHQWVDVSDGERGLALLNDGKYGHRVKDRTISLALLRSPMYPDRTADRGDHVFSYALFPHAGAVTASPAAELAAHLNAPVLVADAEPAAPPFTVVGEGVRLDVVKVAEDGDGLVLRLHEWRGKQATVSVWTPLTGADVVETDLLERALDGGSSSLDALRFGPFEIRTFRLQR